MVLFFLSLADDCCSRLHINMLFSITGSCTVLGKRTREDVQGTVPRVVCRDYPLDPCAINLGTVPGTWTYASCQVMQLLSFHSDGCHVCTDSRG